MPWVRFNKDYDYKTSPQSVTAYKKDGEYLVSEKCKDEVVEKNAGDVIADPTEARRKKKAKE